MAHGYDELKVEFAEGNDPIDSGSLSWTDRTSKVRHVTVNRGRPGPLDNFSPGTCTVQLNNNAATFTPTSNTNILPGLPVRVSATDSGGSRRNLFTGFTNSRDGWTFDYQPNLSFATCSASDLLTRFANYQLPAAVPPATAMEGGYQQDIVANLISLYPDLFPAWAAPFVSEGQTIMGDLPLGTDALSFFTNLSASEGGAFYVDRDGTAQFDDRYKIRTANRMNNPQVTFDDHKTGGHCSYAITDFTMVYALGIYNSATISTVSEPDIVQSFSDSSSIATYGAAAYPPISGALMSSSTEAYARVRHLVLANKTPFFAPGSLRLYPRRSTDHLDAAIKRELRDNVSALFHPVGGSTEFSLAVEHITHDIDIPTKTWTCDLTFSSLDRLGVDAGQNWFLLDGTSSGILDGTRQLGF